MGPCYDQFRDPPGPESVVNAPAIPRTPLPDWFSFPWVLVSSSLPPPTASRVYPSEKISSLEFPTHLVSDLATDLRSPRIVVFGFLKWGEDTFLLNNSTIKCFEFLRGKCYVNAGHSFCFPCRHLCNDFLGVRDELAFLGTNRRANHSLGLVHEL